MTLKMTSLSCVMCQSREKTHPNLIFHTFPKDKRSCRRWLRALAIEEIKSITPEQLNKWHRVCSRHFSERNYKTGSPSSGLCHHACPDQNFERSPINSENAGLQKKESSVKKRNSSRRNAYPLSQIRLWAKEAKERKRPPEASGQMMGFHEKGSTVRNNLLLPEVACNYKEPYKDTYCEVKSSSSYKAESAPLCPPNPRKTTSKSDEPEEHIGPFRFTVQLHDCRTEMRHPTVQKKNTSVESTESDEVKCLSVSAFTQTESVPLKTSPLPSLKSWQNKNCTPRIKRKEHLQVIEDQSNIEVQEDVALSDKKFVRDPNISRKARDICKDSLLPMDPLTSEGKNVGMTDSTNLPSGINFSSEQIIVNEDSVTEVDKSETFKCGSNCSCQRCKLKLESTKRRPHQAYRGPVRRQVVTTKDGRKKTLMIVNKATLKKLQNRGLIKNLEKKSEKEQASTIDTCKSYLETSTHTIMQAQDLNENEFVNPVGTETSYTQPSISVGKQIELTHSPASHVNSGADMLATTQSWSTGQNLCESAPSEVVDASASQVPIDSQITVVVNASTANPKSVTSTVKLPEETNNCPVFQTSTQCLDLRLRQDPQWLTEESHRNEELTESTKDSTILMSKGKPINTSTFAHGIDQNEQFTACTPKIGLHTQDFNQAFTSDYPPQNMEVLCNSPPTVVPPSLEGSPASLQLDHPEQKRRQMFKYEKVITEKPSGAMQIDPLGKCADEAQSIHLTGQDSAEYYEKEKQRLKDKYKSLLKNHRKRYCQLLKKYKSLEKKCRISGYIGSREQIVRDARKYLSAEQVLLLESQMFLRNRTGTGNRFSKKFIRYMMMLYERSSAGYRFLRTIFTIPTVKTIQKWQSRPYDILDESLKDPLEIIVDNTEVEFFNENMPVDEIIYRHENLVITNSRDAIEKEFSSSQRHFSGNRRTMEMESDSSSDDSGSESCNPEDIEVTEDEENLTMGNGKDLCNGDRLGIEDLITID